MTKPEAEAKAREILIAHYEACQKLNTWNEAQYFGGQQETLEQRITQALIELAGPRAEVSRYEYKGSPLHIIGSDGCKTCELGRVTTFVFNERCIKCDPESYEPKPPSPVETCRVSDEIYLQPWSYDEADDWADRSIQEFAHEKNFSSDWILDVKFLLKTFFHRGLNEGFFKTKEALAQPQSPGAQGVGVKDE